MPYAQVDPRMQSTIGSDLIPGGLGFTMGTLALQTIGFWPLLFLFLIFLFVCAVLIFFILMQRGKGEGLAGLLGGGAASDGMGTPEAQKELDHVIRIAGKDRQSQ